MGAEEPDLSETHHKGCRKRDDEGRDEQNVGGGRRRFITTNAIGGLTGRRRRGDEGRRCDWGSS